MNFPITLIVPGQPIPKARARVTSKGVYTPKSTVGHEEAIIAAARQAGVRDEPTKAFIDLRIWFYRKNQVKADLDNLAKTVKDALNGVIWHDDNQVVDIEAHKRIDRKNPRTLIMIREVTE